MKCETCKYAKVEYMDDGVEGIDVKVVTDCQCLRYAPRPFEQGPGTTWKAQWPGVDPDRWCGEWKAKEKDN